MTKEYRFWQVDSFSKTPYLGNPCGVVFDADELSSTQMQTIARQMNLSETVFLSKPTTAEADFESRIFTPRNELPFAGHPTIASAFSYYSTLNGTAKPTVLRQECGVGIIPLEISNDGGDYLFMMTAGEPSAVDAGVDRDLAGKMLGIDAESIVDVPIEVCSVGLPWLIIPVKSMEELSAGKPDQGLIEKICRERKATGVTAYAPGAQIEGCSYHIRSFVPGQGIPEDPVCGSGNAAVALHIARHSSAGKSTVNYRAEQGLEIERAGILHLEVKNVETTKPVVRLGGNAVRVLDGKLWI